MLEEIAEAQEVMSESLEASLSQSLEKFSEDEMKVAEQLKLETDVSAQTAEAAMDQYLQGTPPVTAHNAAVERRSSESWQKLGLRGSLESSLSWWRGNEDSFPQEEPLEEQTAADTARSLGPGGRIRRSIRLVSEASGRASNRSSAQPMLEKIERVRIQEATAEVMRFQLYKQLSRAKVSTLI